MGTAGSRPTRAAGRRRRTLAREAGVAHPARLEVAEEQVDRPAAAPAGDGHRLVRGHRLDVRGRPPGRRRRSGRVPPRRTARRCRSGSAGRAGCRGRPGPAAASGSGRRGPSRSAIGARARTGRSPRTARVPRCDRRSGPRAAACRASRSRPRRPGARPTGVTLGQVDALLARQVRARWHAPADSPRRRRSPVGSTPAAASRAPGRSGPPGRTTTSGPPRRLADGTSRARREAATALPPATRRAATRLASRPGSARPTSWPCRRGPRPTRSRSRRDPAAALASRPVPVVDEERSVDRLDAGGARWRRRRGGGPGTSTSSRSPMSRSFQSFIQEMYMPSRHDRPAVTAR